MNEMYKLALASIEELGIASIERLLSEYDNEECVWKLNDEDILKITYLTKRQKASIVNARKRFDLKRMYDYASRCNTKLVSYRDEEYPKRLKEVINKPAYIFYIGELPRDDAPTVSIIGARMCSGYGKEAATYFSEILARNGVQIISGLASGIDGFSQRAALDAGGKSYGILGSGVDVCYPISNKKIYEDLKVGGGIISEYPLRAPAINYHFPMRNRIISGLSDIVLVVEAKEKSGTAITVSMALEQGKDVYAVPGNFDSSLSLGCNKMIYEGAGIAYCPEVIINALKDMGYKTGANNYSSCDKIEKVIMKLSKLGGISLAGLQQELLLSGDSMDVKKLEIILMELVMDGKLKVINNKYYS